MRRIMNGSLAAGRRLSHLMSRPSNRLLISVPLRGEISTRAGLMFGGASSVISDVPQAALSPQKRPPRAGQKHVSRGTLDERSFALFYLTGDILKALFSLGRPTSETRLAEGLTWRSTQRASATPAFSST